MSTETLLWTPADDGYALALDGDELVCKNAKGKILASMPKAVREDDTAEGLIALRDWMADHTAHCRLSAETWLLRSLPVPRAVLIAVWPRSGLARCARKCRDCADRR